MKPTEIRYMLAVLASKTDELETAYIDNGGEVTEQTEERERELGAIRDLLTGEGVDSLGRWLRSVEDAKAALKDEKAAIDRAIRAKDRTIEYIKGLVTEVLAQTGQDRVKGTAYSFTASRSRTTSVDKERLLDQWGEKVAHAVYEAGVPDYITVTLGASVKAVPEGAELPDIFRVEERDTVTFRKPKKEVLQNPGE